MAEMAEPVNNIIQAIKSYGRQLFGFIRSRVRTNEDAEDILQDVWYQLSARSDVEAIESISGWLYKVARNKITDNFRKKKNELLDDLSFPDQEGGFQEIFSAENDTPETEQLRELFREELLAALEELPENQRQVFIMNELEDLTLQEIADKEGEKLKTII